MSTRFTTWFDTPFKRSAAMFAALLLATLAVRLAAGTPWQPILLACLPGAVAFVLLRRVWREWAVLKRQIMRREVRLFRSWHALTTRPPLVLVLHRSSIALAFASCAATVGVGKTPGSMVMNGCLFFLALAGLCDMIVLISRVARRTWAHAAGKVFGLTVGVALAAVSLAVAKDVAHGITHIDPKFLGEFTALLTCCTLPFVYVGAASAALLLYATWEILLFFVIGLLSTVVTTVFAVPHSFAGRRRKKSWSMTWYRLRNGKCPPGGALPKTGFMSQEEILRITSPLSKLALAMVLVTGAQQVTTGVPVTSPFLGRLMVSMEYRPDSGCINLDPVLPVAYMEDGWVSVARRTEDSVGFSTLKCEVASPDTAATPDQATDRITRQTPAARTLPVH